MHEVKMDELRAVQQRELQEDARRQKEKSRPGTSRRQRRAIKKFKDKAMVREKLMQEQNVSPLPDPVRLVKMHRQAVQMLVSKMTNHERSLWAKAGYPKDADSLKKFGAGVMERMTRL